MSESLKEKIGNLATDVHALYLASKEPEVPWYAKALMALLIGYFVCPIDPIPDFIPLIGELDELIVIPAGIAVVTKMIPKSVMEDCRKRAREEPVDTKTKWVIVAVIIVFWVFVAYGAWNYLGPILFH